MAAPLAARPVSTSIVPVMQAGYAGRAGVYVIVGVLAALAAWGGGSAQGTRGALAQVAADPWGDFALLLIGFGLLAYSVWRVVDAFMDLESYGSGLKGAAARIGMAGSGLVHLGLAIYCASLVFGLGASGGGSGASGGGTRGVTAWLLAQPWGRWVVIGAGIVVVVVGFYYAAKGATGSYRREFRATETTEKLDPVMRAGLLAQGFVVAVVGGFIAWAGWTRDASEAGGLGNAFSEIRSAPWGQALLIAVTLGLVAFALYNAIRAVHGVVPRAAPSDTKTLSGGAIGEMTGRAEAMKNRAESAAHRAAHG